jgi:TolB protein
LADSDISQIVSSDLARSGKFSPVPEKELLARPQQPEDIHFKTWRVAGIDHLVIGAVQRTPNNMFKVEFRLFNVYRGEQVLGYSFNATRATLRKTAHQISDLIFEKLTGLPGAFNSRIAYVTSSGKPMEYRLQVADTDGYNPQTLLTSKEPIMSPVWSPDGSRVAYVSFETGLSAIFIHNIHTGEREKIASFDGINSAPAWSPDGKTIAMTLSKDGNPDIYIMSLANKALRRLTNHWAIDTEPAWMPDSKSLVFTSSRSGKPQLYELSLAKGSRPKRLTFDGNYNANASVSVDGKVITFVHAANNSYKIAVLYTDTRVMQVLTDGPLDESPDFAPNGTMILYASQDRGKAVLAAVSTDGRQKQRLALTDGEVREPSWAAKRN